MVAVGAFSGSAVDAGRVTFVGMEEVAGWVTMREGATTRSFGKEAWVSLEIYACRLLYVGGDRP